jgi:hypothetical protein
MQRGNNLEYWRDVNRQYDRMDRRRELIKEKAKHIGGNADADTLYYNILVTNNTTGYDASGNSTITKPNIPLVFNEARSQPYINCASEYFMSVMRFSLDSQNLPLFIPEPISGLTYPNAGVGTIYAVTLIANGKSYKADVYWLPQNQSTPAPATTDNYTSNPWWYCYSYEYFINLINNAFQSCLSAILPNLAGPAPFLTYENGIISIVGQKSIYQTNVDGSLTNPTGYEVYMNTSLYNLFCSLPAIKKAEPANNANNGLNENYQLLFVENPSGLTTIEVPTDLTNPAVTYTAIKSTCDFIPLATWNPIQSIVFTTSLLPVVPELNAKPAIYGASNNIYTTTLVPNGQQKNPDGSYTSLYTNSTYLNNQNAEVRSILFEFVAPATLNGIEYKPTINYAPVAEYRLVDLYDDKPINQLEISAFWKDRYGNLIPYLLPAGASASIKIMFRKKEFNFEY